MWHCQGQVSRAGELWHLQWSFVLPTTGVCFVDLSHAILPQFLMISIAILMRLSALAWRLLELHRSAQISPSAIPNGYAQTLSLPLSNCSPSFFLFPFSGMPAKDKINLTLVKVVRKTLFRTIVRGGKTITIGERDGALLQIQQRQLGIYSQQAE